jgi:hypothetical protein
MSWIEIVLCVVLYPLLIWVYYPVIAWVIRRSVDYVMSPPVNARKIRLRRSVTFGRIQ